MKITFIIVIKFFFKNTAKIKQKIPLRRESSNGRQLHSNYLEHSMGKQREKYERLRDTEDRIRNFNIIQEVYQREKNERTEESEYLKRCSLRNFQN